MQVKARVVVSMGDPRGIGPELCLKLGSDLRWLQEAGAAVTVAGSLDVMEVLAGKLRMDFDPVVTDRPLSEAGSLGVMDIEAFDSTEAADGAPSAESGQASLRYIESAVSAVLSGEAEAVVTCPVSKEALSAAGISYPGHTEMLGQLSGSSGQPVMMMLARRLKVAFVTTHVALRELSASISSANVEHAASVFSGALQKYFGLREPEIALCALNPHAGDGGRFGDEEARILCPSVERLRNAGINVEGPFPADSLFYKVNRGEYNGVLALYHDQGMIPVKISGPDEVVNITLGLPIIRTSPAHGTAFDIAGQGVAEPASLKKAVDVAVDMALSQSLG